MYVCTLTIAGGHINPAVTFGLFVARKVTITRAVTYIVAQCLGAIAGAAIARGVQGNAEFNAARGAVNGVRPGFSIQQALAAEIMGTFVLLFTVLSATDPQRNARDSHVPVSNLKLSENNILSNALNLDLEYEYQNYCAAYLAREINQVITSFSAHVVHY